MNIVLIHYHLKTGGVTTVIKRQIEVLQNDCRVLVITGETPDEALPFDTVTLPDLGYDNRIASPSANPEHVAQSIVDAIYSKWKNGCDLIHVHNPTLAKNRNFIKVLKALQQKKMRLFLQIHDFAEDGRPSAYFEDDYPADCHYGVINSRDLQILLNAGLKKEGLHLLSNAVAPLAPALNRKKTIAADNFVLYPVRAIRRKNIGEAILWSLFFKNGETLCITLPPNSLSDFKPYRQWQALVKAEGLKVTFEAGLTQSFENLVSSAQSIITTSITEGFGFCFLEPWINHKFLWGRQLPDITNDFKHRGVNLNHLYQSLQIPPEQIDTKCLNAKRRRAISDALAKFNAKGLRVKIENELQSVENAKETDFGLLDESFQRRVITHLLNDRKAKNRLQELNPILSAPGESVNHLKLIRRNRNTILHHFNVSRYRTSLLNIYQQVMRHPVRQQIDKTRLLASFLKPETFSLLKWGNDAD